MACKLLLQIPQSWLTGSVGGGIHRLWREAWYHHLSFVIERVLLSDDNIGVYRCTCRAAEGSEYMVVRRGIAVVVVVVVLDLEFIDVLL